MLNKVCIIISLIILASCKLGPNYQQKQWDIDDKYNSKSEVEQEDITIKWWENFNDPVLTKLIEEAVKNNHDIKIALANIRQSRAIRMSSFSGFLPSFGASSEGKRSRASELLSSTRESDSFTSQLDASWELDIWGKTRRSVESADANIDAAKENKNYVTLSVIAEVSRNYFELRGLQKRISTLKHNVELLKEVEDLANAQLETGTATELDVSSARGEREETQSRIPNLKAELQAVKYRLSVLSGKLPEAYSSKLDKVSDIVSPPEIVKLGLRSDILRRRPDVREAERNLAAVTADIGVKTADLFPSFSLTGALGTGARIAGDLFAGGSGTYTLAGGVNWSIFEGGAKRASLEQAKAIHEKEFVSYEKAVISAIEDSESSLIRYEKELKTLKELKAAEKSRREGFKIAKYRYEAGEDNFLTILDAERSLISIEDEVIKSRVRALTSLTQLYKSLGGGWESFSDT